MMVQPISGATLNDAGLVALCLARLGSATQGRKQEMGKEILNIFVGF